MAYLEITLKLSDDNRPRAAGVYQRLRQPFLDTVTGAVSKELLIRDTDVQVLHRFDTVDSANAYLDSELFTVDVVTSLAPLLEAEPEIRIYDIA